MSLRSIPPEMDGEKPRMETTTLQKPTDDSHQKHVRNFLDCMKSRAKPSADVEEGHRTAIMCHLGNISTRLGRTLRWDAAKEQVIGDAEANQWLMRPYRGAWKLA